MQVLKEFESVVSLPKKRSRISKENGYYWEKKLSESQKTLLDIHDKTNWKDVELTQGYKTPKGIRKEIVWNFHTKKLNYPIIKFNKKIIKVANNKTFAFYVKPKNGKNILLTNCSYNVKNLKVVNVDKNVNLITLQGRVGSYAKCSLSDGESVKFIVLY